MITGGLRGVLKHVSVPLPFFYLGAMFVTIFAVCALPEQSARDIVKEDGVVELISAVLWFFIAVIIACYGKTKQQFLLIVFPLFCGMRELDWHKKWTTDTVLKPKYWWVQDSFSMTELIIAVVLIIFLIAMFSSFISYHRLFLKLLAKRDIIAVNLFISGIILIASKIVEKYGVLELLIVDVSANTVYTYTMVAEEIMELSAVLIVIGVSFFWIKTRKNNLL